VAQPERSWWSWRVAAVVGAGVLFCLFVSFFIGAIFGQPYWLVGGDTGWILNSAEWASAGGLVSVYKADPWYLTLPGYLYLLAPVVALGNHLGLVINYPYQLSRPSMWLLVGPFNTVVGMGSLLGVDYLAATLAITPRRRMVLVGALAVLVVTPTLLFAGHPEDLVALGMSAVALALTLKSRYRPAALWLGVAVLMQVWAALLVPLVAALAGRKQVMRVLVLGYAPAAVMAVAMFAATPAQTWRSLVIQPAVFRGSHLVWARIAHRVYVQGNPGWVGSEVRTLVLVTALLGALWVRGHPERLLPMAMVVMFARAFFDIEMWPYYTAPVVVLISLLALKCPTKTAMTAVAFAFCLYAASCGGYQGFVIPDWLLTLLVLVSFFGAVVVLQNRARKPTTSVVDQVSFRCRVA